MFVSLEEPQHLAMCQTLCQTSLRDVSNLCVKPWFRCCTADVIDRPLRYQIIGASGSQYVIDYSEIYLTPFIGLFTRRIAVLMLFL